MRIGVVIPAFNRPTLTIEALESVDAQTRPADRVVVVDDASTDDTAERITAWMADRSGWETIRLERNGGVSVARNRGLEAVADCDVVAFLDSDDLWPTEHLAQFEAAFRAHPDAVAVVAAQNEIRPGQEPRLKQPDWMEPDLVCGLIREAGCTPSAVAVSRRGLDAVGGFREDYRRNEDQEFFVRLAQAGPWRASDGPPIQYRIAIGQERHESASLSRTSEGGAERRLASVRAAYERDPRPALRRLLAWAHFRAGRRYLQTGAAKPARNHLWSAIRAHPWHPRPWLLLLRCLVIRR